MWTSTGSTHMPLKLLPRTLYISFFLDVEDAWRTELIANGMPDSIHLLQANMKNEEPCDMCPYDATIVCMSF